MKTFLTTESAKGAKEGMTKFPALHCIALISALFVLSVVKSPGQSVTNETPSFLPIPVRLAWSPATNAGILGYTLRVGTNSGGETMAMPMTTNCGIYFVCLQPEMPDYFFTVTATSQAGQVSPASNEASWTPEPSEAALDFTYGISQI